MAILLQVLPKGSAQYNKIVAKSMTKVSGSGAATRADSKQVSSGGDSNVEQPERQAQDNDVEF